jgi:hypothetical protein
MAQRGTLLPALRSIGGALRGGVAPVGVTSELAARRHRHAADSSPLSTCAASVAPRAAARALPPLSRGFAGALPPPPHRRPSLRR